MTVLATLQSDLSARPKYAAPIYGAPLGGVPGIPQGLPPFFLAVAQDNGAAFLVDRFYATLLAAGYKPELHRFQSGGPERPSRPGDRAQRRWSHLSTGPRSGPGEPPSSWLLTRLRRMPA